MSGRSRRHVLDGATAPRALLLLAGLALGAVGSRAQAPPASSTAAARDAGRARGHEDGTRQGERDGDERGRAQVLVDAFVRGFRTGLREPLDRRDVEEAWADGREASWDAGAAEGRAEGARRGREAAEAAYGRLAGRPSFRPEAPPPPRTPPAPAGDSCAAPATLAVDAGRGVHVRLDPRDLERRGSPLGFDIPRAELPSGRWLADAAIADGHSESSALAAWTGAYREAFERAHEVAYEREQDDIASWQRDRHEQDGAIAGRDEALRRARCEAFARGADEGYRAGFDEGFTAAFEQAWADVAGLHDTQAVVRVESARLVDSSGDGILEPGERARLEVTMANAGLMASTTRPLSWRGVSGLSGSGSLRSGLEPQARRSEVVDAGVIEEDTPLGSAIVVRIDSEGQEPSELTTRAGRPLLLDAVDAELKSIGGELIALLRPRVSNVSSLPVDRPMHVTAGPPEGSSRPVALTEVIIGPVAPGQVATPEIAVAVDAAQALDGFAGTVALRERSGAFWMQREWKAALGVPEAVRLVGSLTDPAPLVTAISKRLRREFEAALAEPKLYGRAGSKSELAQYAAALASSPEPARRVLTAEVSAPLLRDSQRKDVPRRVKKAVRDALEGR